MTAGALRDEITAFFERFARAFDAVSGAQVADLYHVPGIALRASGAVQAVQSRAEVERFFQAALDGYRAEGCRTCRFTDLEVLPLGGRSALGTVTWELLGAGGRVVRTWRQSYNLLRVEGRWQVIASTYHLESIPPQGPAPG